MIGDELHHVLLVWIGTSRRTPQLRRALQLHEALRANPDGVEHELKRNALTGPLVAEMRPLRRQADSFHWRVAVVSSQDWSTTETRLLSSANNDGMDWWDLRRLTDLAAARLDPSWLEATTEIFSQ